ncbi:MAG TPA: TIGR00730 family Rossman fold protein [Spirochaetota bacterium]|nr:TIGR00730 family Rossman fold protein [Spirochaetota bacterium]
MEKAALAYRNEDFMNSDAARELRILSEYLEPLYRFKKFNVRNTITFFGSARIPDKKNKSKKKADALAGLTNYYHDAVLFAKKLTQWAIAEAEKSYSEAFSHQVFYIMTGGGPGIMEAVNKGARLAKGRSIGLNIALPYEQKPNDYQTPELNFEFKYFFMRKLWFSLMTRAVVIFPGGFGTMDEFMEILTLIQTNKMPQVPIILYGKDFWRKTIDFSFLAKSGVISGEDLKLFKVIDDVKAGVDYILKRIKLK